MRILVTGAKGQLGTDVVTALTGRSHECIGVDIEEMDITNEAAVASFFARTSPEAVIHCAAYTAVDAAEENEKAARRINAAGTEYIAKACETLDIPMMYISTDYVFNGEGTRPWAPEDEAHPLNIYGQTKYEGEQALQKHVKKFFIVRIAWVFGLNGKNFVRTMLQLAKTHDTLTVVNDQVGSPTYTYDLARLLADIIETDKYGIYHATNEGYCSWYDFAVEIFKTAKVPVKVVPVGSEAYPTPAKRPKNSRMDKEKLRTAGFTPLPSWQDALRRYVPLLLKAEKE